MEISIDVGKDLSQRLRLPMCIPEQHLFPSYIDYQAPDVGAAMLDGKAYRAYLPVDFNVTGIYHLIGIKETLYMQASLREEKHREATKKDLLNLRFSGTAIGGRIIRLYTRTLGKITYHEEVVPHATAVILEPITLVEYLIPEKFLILDA